MFIRASVEPPFKNLLPFNLSKYFETWLFPENLLALPQKKRKGESRKNKSILKYKNYSILSPRKAGALMKLTDRQKMCMFTSYLGVVKIIKTTRNKSFYELFLRWAIMIFFFFFYFCKDDPFLKCSCSGCYWKYCFATI